MERKIVKSTTLLTTAIFLLSMMAIVPPIHALPGPKIYIDHPIYYTTANSTLGPPATTFNVTIWIENVTLADAGLDGFQIELHYDDSIINVTEDASGIRGWPSARYTPSQKFDTNYVFYGAAAVSSAMLYPTYTHIGAGHGSVLIADAIITGTAWKGTKGLLAIIEFKVTALPEKLGSLSCTLDITNAYTWIKPDSLQTKATYIDGSYTNDWEKPGPAHLGLNQLSWTFGPFPPSAKYQTFDVIVSIKSLALAWYMSNATFDLEYNATVIDVIGDTANVTVANPPWQWSSVIFTRNPSPAVLDIISFVLKNPVYTPNGTVLCATIHFTVMMQRVVPPAPAGSFDRSNLIFKNVVFMDHKGSIDQSAHDSGQVTVYSLVSIPMGLFKVDPPYIEYGPAPVLGTEFNVSILISGPPPTGLHYAWHLIAFQFRLLYCPDLLEVVNIYEGPFLLKYAKYGTFFMSGIEADGVYGPHIWAGNMLLPNPNTGEYDFTSWPNGTGVIVIIQFKIIKQLVADCHYTGAYLECELGLVPLFEGPPEAWALDKDGNWIAIDRSSNVNGTYRIIETPSSNGRIIDVYGGAVNRGYGVPYGTPSAFPEPYGGQGQGGNMDLVIPQSVVYLLARVTYNCWPVQQKDVGFEIEGPYYQEGWTPENPVRKPGDYPCGPFHIRKYSNRTDEMGIVWIKFQMLWPCVNPEDLFGKYRVTATVDICGVVVTDVLWFDYYYLVEITKVTTDKYYYRHCEYVAVTVTFKSKAQQPYPVLSAVVIQDELETAFGYNTIEFWAEGAQFCHWKEYTFTTYIHVEKWAFAGFAHIYVSAFDKDPTIGGAPWCPTYGLGWPPGATVPEIYIKPE